MKNGISKSQFGFKQGIGTREALFGINILIQRYLDVNRNTFACFIDFTEEFDNV